MKKYSRGICSVLGAAALGVMAGCVSPCADAPFAKYDSKLGWHHHPVMNYGIVQQGALTIIGLDGKETTIHAGEPVVEMVGTIHHGENRGDKTVVLDMFYISQKGTPIAVQHPEIRK